MPSVGHRKEPGHHHRYPEHCDYVAGEASRYRCRIQAIERAPEPRRGNESRHTNHDDPDVEYLRVRRPIGPKLTGRLADGTESGIEERARDDW